MLPDEVLRDIVFPAIWRNPKARQLLETLEITSRRFNAVAVSLIEEGIVGVRVVTRMRVYNTGEVILLADDGSFKTITFDYLVGALRRLDVRKVEYVGTFNQRVLEGMLPAVDQLRNAMCTAPKTFSSPAKITRAFSEVLFADVLHIEQLRLDGDWRSCVYDGTLVSLPCLQQCRLLNFSSGVSATSQFGSKMVQWLNDGTSGQTKQLSLGASATHGKLIEDLKKISSCEVTSSYELTLIYSNAYEPAYRHLENQRTMEMLVVQRTSDRLTTITRRIVGPT